MVQWDGSLSSTKAALSKVLARGASTGAEEAMFLETNAQLLQDAVTLGTPDVALFVLERLCVYMIQHGIDGNAGQATSRASSGTASSSDSASKDQAAKLLEENKRQLARVQQLEKELVGATAKTDNAARHTRELTHRVSSLGKQLEAEVRDVILHKYLSSQINGYTLTGA